MGGNRRPRLEPKDLWVKRKEKQIDPLEFIRQNYPNCSRAEIKDLDKYLYRVLIKKDLLKQIPTLEQLIQDKPMLIHQRYYQGFPGSSLMQANRLLWRRLKETGDYDKLYDRNKPVN